MRTHDWLVGPLYEQVLDRLRHRIVAGEWQAGVPLPSEVHLSHEFGVSVGTMRKALDMLVKQRIVMRKRGRGTFVNERMDSDDHELIGIRGADGRHVDLEITLIHHCTAAATPAEASALRLSSGADTSTVLRIARDWRTQGNLICRETIVVDPHRFSELISKIPKRPVIHDVYARDYNTPVERSVWTIGSANSISHCGTDTEPAVTTVQLERVAFTAADQPIEYACKTLLLAGQHIELVAFGGR